MEQPDFQTLLNFFKVLAHESRLKLLGFLAEQEYSVSELAHLLDLKDPTVSHHLMKLQDLGLVSMRQEGTSHYYKLDTGGLQRLNKEVLTPEKVAAFADESPGNDWERRVMKTFVEGQTLKQIPYAYKKRLVILRWLANDFAEGLRYPEKEVNEIIARHHPDYATLRRDLIENKFMAREHGLYWRLPPEITEPHITGLLNSKWES